MANPWHFPTPRPGWHSNSWQGRLRPPAEVGWPCHTPACRCAPARRSRRNSGNLQTLEDLEKPNRPVSSPKDGKNMGKTLNMTEVGVYLTIFLEKIWTLFIRLRVLMLCFKVLPKLLFKYHVYSIERWCPREPLHSHPYGSQSLILSFQIHPHR